MTARFVRLNSKAIISVIALLSLLTNMQFASEVNAEVQTENKTRQVFEIKNFPRITIPAIDELPEDMIVEPGEVNLDTLKLKNSEVLAEYLASKQSPLSDKANYLLNQRDWRLIIAISQAESQMCKRQLGYNCWGIGGGAHRKYPNLEFAITDAQTVIGKYVDSGADTAKEILPNYVGWDNQNWVYAVNAVLYQLDQLPIEA
ncbi:MAG: hypothetical protein HYW51_00655 [Candidatus Doudnabacteria bacterium]|nr:hypothetical protein [Candidatus Doudnabacteria bacterium]